MDKQADRQRGRRTDGQTDGETDGQTDRQICRQASKQTKKWKESSESVSQVFWESVIQTADCILLCKLRNFETPSCV